MAIGGKKCAVTPENGGDDLANRGKALSVLQVRSEGLSRNLCRIRVLHGKNPVTRIIFSSVVFSIVIQYC